MPRILPDAKKIGAAALIVAGLFLVYWQVFVGLVDAWISDGNYSHGFVVVPIALYFAWERRTQLAAAEMRPSWFGLVIMAASTIVLLAGLLGSELFLSRISLLGTLVGIVLFLFGWAHLRILALPLAFLALMIPLPAILFNQIAFPLQLLASRFGEFAISSCDIPVLREGNVLILSNTSLEVAEACSGIRSLVSLISLSLVYGYFADTRGWVRTVILLSSIPVAIVANGARVAGTGILAHWWGSSAAEGFFHEFSGWVVFMVAFGMILGIHRLIVRLAPSKPKPVGSVGVSAPGTAPLLVRSTHPVAYGPALGASPSSQAPQELGSRVAETRD
jgi:exosortase